MGAFGTTHRRAFLAAGWVRGFECDVLDLSTYSRLLMHGCTRSQARTTTSRHSAASSACRSPAATSASRPATTADPPSMASDATRSAWRAMRHGRRGERCDALAQRCVSAGCAAWLSAVRALFFPLPRFALAGSDDERAAPYSFMFFTTNIVYVLYNPGEPDQPPKALTMRGPIMTHPLVRAAQV